MVSALAPIADSVIGLYLLESGSSRLPTVPRRMRMHNRCVGHHGGRHVPSVGRRATIGVGRRPASAASSGAWAVRTESPGNRYDDARSRHQSEHEESGGIAGGE